MDARKVWLGLVIAGVVSSQSLAQGWTGGATDNRYSQPSPPPAAPSMTQRTTDALSSSGAAVRDGFNAGVSAAQQSYNDTVNGGSARGPVSSPWTNPASTATMPATAAPSSPWTSNATAGTAATRPTTITAVDGGWTSIANTPAPPALIPSTPMTMPVANYSSATAANIRPSLSNTFPATASTQPIPSVLADPAKSPTAMTTTVASPPATDNWSSNWADNNAGAGASISRNGSTPATTTGGRDTGFPTLPATNGATGVSDPWNQTAPATTPSISAAGNGGASGRTNYGAPATTAAATNTGFGGQPTTGAAGPAGIGFANQPPLQNNGAMTNGQMAGQTNYQTPGGFAQQGPGTVPNNGLPSVNPTTANKLAQNTPQEPQPWMPLIAAVLTLAGSLAANLYLGVSYLDARQKYQSLVRKTADTFRRVKAVAA